MKYIKNIDIVDAVKYTRRFWWPDWFHDAVTDNRIMVYGTGKWTTLDEKCYAIIKTNEGPIKVNENDYIVNTYYNNIYPVKKELFEYCYKAIKEE